MERIEQADSLSGISKGGWYNNNQGSYGFGRKIPSNSRSINSGID